MNSFFILRPAVAVAFQPAVPAARTGHGRACGLHPRRSIIPPYVITRPNSPRFWDQPFLTPDPCDDHNGRHRRDHRRWWRQLKPPLNVKQMTGADGRLAPLDFRSRARGRGGQVVDGHAIHGARREVGLDPRADLRRVGGAAARAASPAEPAKATAGATRAVSPPLGRRSGAPGHPSGCQVPGSARHHPRCSPIFARIMPVSSGFWRRNP